MSTDYVPILLSSGIGFAGAILGAFAAGRAMSHIETLNIKYNIYGDRRHIYSQLLGNKSLILQSNVSYFSAFIETHLYEAQSSLVAIFDKLDGKSQDEMVQNLQNSIGYQLSVHAKQRSENLQFKIAESNYSMWETIGQIQILFPDSTTTEVDQLINQIRQIERNFEYLENNIILDFRNFRVATLNESRKISLNQVHIDNWSSDKLDELDQICNDNRSHIREISDDLESKIDELLKIVKDNIYEDA